MTNPTYAIVSPYQGVPLNSVAKLSFERTAKLMGNHRWIFALPTGTDLTPLNDVCGDIEARFFDPGYFVSKRAAQLFYMHPPLFEAFSDFDYILIHQPDVYIFDDQLDYWMNYMAENNYDYIGAPWWNHEWLQFAKNPLSRLPWHWLLNNKVGSGGFSIRNPRKFAKIAHKNLKLIKKLSAFVPEDIWWCQLAQWFGEPISRPKPEIAASFAFETQCIKCLDINGGKLPFAVHGWNRHDWSFWKGKIPGVDTIYDELAKQGVKQL